MFVQHKNVMVESVTGLGKALAFVFPIPRDRYGGTEVTVIYSNQIDTRYQPRHAGSTPTATSVNKTSPGLTGFLSPHRIFRRRHKLFFVSNLSRRHQCSGAGRWILVG